MDLDLEVASIMYGVKAAHLKTWQVILVITQWIIYVRLQASEAVLEE